MMKMIVVTVILNLISKRDKVKNVHHQRKKIFLKSLRERNMLGLLWSNEAYEDTSSKQN